ncbi:MAG: TRAP transporter permease [Clostridiales bacterium]|jgi:TRAP transporter 4TM/12TM fusion protein|nr:TRAP transporter permease [Clostridiales bacterium]
MAKDTNQLDKQIQLEEDKQRTLPKNIMYFVMAISIVFVLWQLYVLFISPIDPLLLRTVHICFVLLLGFLYFPLSDKMRKDKVHFIDLILAAGALALMFYTISEYKGITLRSGVNPTQLDIIFGVILIVSIIEMARRTTGITLPIIAIIFLLYALYGANLPGLLGHPKYSFKRVVSFLFGVQGIFSEPVGVSATFVFMFILFGALLNTSGAGEAIIDFAKSIAGGKRGGPAKVAILSSALFGSISGSAVANVVVTGTFTIPLMKKTGYDSHFAGAVEAVASTGGQITPPVLGAAAFLIAEVLGVPYSKIVIATIIPALLYYICLFAVVDFEAAKKNLLGLSKEELPRMNQVFKKHGLLLFPILVLLFFLVVVGLSPLKSALYSAISVIIFALLNPNTRKNVAPKKLLETVITAPKDLITVASTCAAAGIVVGTMSLTGLGHRFSILLIELSDGRLIPALLLTMIVAIILGMGVPPVAAYAIAGSAVGPALVSMGVPPLAAHLFIFYFCAVSVITPPVALAAYAAAALAKDSMWKVGVTAFRLGITGFIIPYVFVYNQTLLMQGNAIDIILAFITSVVGVVVLAACIQGWFKKFLKLPIRLLLAIAAFSLIIPGIKTDLIGVACIAIFLLCLKFNIGVYEEEKEIKPTAQA